MAEGDRKGFNPWMIGLFVVVLGISALNIATGTIPWILLPFGLFFVIYLFGKKGPAQATATEQAGEVRAGEVRAGEQVQATDATASASPDPAATGRVLPGPDVVARVTELKRAGQTVEAIEALRQATGMELYEASQYVREL